MDLGFPWWVRLAHLFNILFLTLLMRSGIEILAAHPKLYLNDDAKPGSESVRFTPKRCQLTSSGRQRTKRKRTRRGLHYLVAVDSASGDIGTSSALSGGC
jgi:hypothetical protein